MRRFTPARVALGRAGHALPTAEVLRFALAHARARDAVHAVLDLDVVERGMTGLGLAVQRVESAAPDRVTYLARPNLGRRLSDRSRSALDELNAGRHELAIVVADGLSSIAVARNAVPLLAALTPWLEAAGIERPALILATQARVALGDEIGERLGARMVLMLIGERPGLSAPDGLGAYLTFAPRRGRTDAERNCVSNIRPEGLPIELAAFKIAWLIGEALRRELTGVALKDESDGPLVDGRAPRPALPFSA